jgi:hypothetical protein
MHGVTPYLLLAMLGAAIAGAGFVAAGAGGTAPTNPDLGFYLAAKARAGETVDPALAVAAGIPDRSGRERALIYAAIRDLARSAGNPDAAERAMLADNLRSFPVKRKGNRVEHWSSVELVVQCRCCIHIF